MPMFRPSGIWDEYELCKGVHVTERRAEDGRLVLRFDSARKITDSTIRRVFKGPHTEFHALHELSSGGSKKDGYWLIMEELYEGEVEWPASAPHGPAYWKYLSQEISRAEYAEIRKAEVEAWNAHNPKKPLKTNKFTFGGRQ